MKNFALVYQVGIANIFEVRDFTLAPNYRLSKRVYQGDFRTAESMARGMVLAGANVRTFACNMAGDITNQIWTNDLESQPFSDKFMPVFS